MGDKQAARACSFQGPDVAMGAKVFRKGQVLEKEWTLPSCDCLSAQLD